MKFLLYLGIILMLASCGSNESESAISTTTKEELPKQPNCSDIDGIEIKSYSDFENIPSDYTGLVFECRGDNVQGIYTYKNGIKDGPRRNWYANGQLNQDEMNKDGRAMGLQREWHENGQLRFKYKVNEKGIEDGPLVEWHENGRMLSKRNYKNGELLSEKCFSEDGKEIDCEQY